MNILMTTDSVGGVWSYSIELCRALAPYGIRVSLACMGGWLDDARREEALALRNVQLHESDFRLEWMDDPWRDVEDATKWMTELARQSRASVVHLNAYGPARGDYGVPVVLAAHSCVHSWWRSTRAAEPDGGLRRYRRCVIEAIGSADRILAPTAAFLDAFLACYPEADATGRTRVIHNGIDDRPWSPSRISSIPFVLGVGRVWDDAKNLRRLTAAVEGLDYAAFIAGPNEGVAATDGIVLLGALPRPRLASWYRRAAVLAHPACYEPFGLSVLEAALCGCPLLLADIPTLRELWHGAARFVPPGDTSGWRRNLQRLLEDEAERRILGRAARARALRYSAARMASEYAALYRELHGARAGAVA